MASDRNARLSYQVATTTTEGLRGEAALNLYSNVQRQIPDPPHGTETHPTNLPQAPPANPSVSSKRRDLWGEASLKLTADQQRILKLEDIPPNNQRSSTPTLITLNGILATADSHVQEKQDKKWTRRWYSLVKSMKRFDALVQAGLDFDPTPYGALVWSVVSFGIEVAISNNDIQDLVYGSCEYVKGIIDEYALYEAKYLGPPSGKDERPKYQGALRVAIVDVYAAVLKYAAELRNYFSHKQSKQLQTGVKYKSDMVADRIGAALRGLEDSSFTPLKKDIEDKRKTSSGILFKLQKELTDAQLSAIDGNIGHIMSQLRQLTKMEEYVAREEDTLILKWISTVTMDEQQKLQRDAAEGDGRGSLKPGDWILREQKYVTWNDSGSEESKTLWLSGAVGTGKSTVTSTVIKDCQGDYGRKTDGPTAYFYCSGITGNSQKEMTAEEILRTILRQLVQWTGVTMDIARAEWVSKNYGRWVQTRSQVEDLIKKIVVHDNTVEVTVIIDGLDELTNDCLKDLLTSLERLLDYDGTVKIFLASRPHLQLAYDLPNIHGTEIMITPKHTEDDMVTYIDTAIGAKMKRLPKKYITPELDARIRKLLTESAQGVFRYVELALNYIFDTDWFIENKVTELELELKLEGQQKRPHQAFVEKSLDPMYKKLYQLIAKDAKENQVLAHRTITWLLCEVYPLPAKEVIKGVCMDTSSPEGKVLHESNKNGKVDVDEALSACHHLVVYHKSTDRLGFGHFSVVEFLRGSSLAIFEDSVAHCTISSACFRVLCSPTAFNVHGPDEPLETYAIFNWAWHYKNSVEPEGVTELQILFSKFWKEGNIFLDTISSTESRVVSFVDQRGERNESGSISKIIASQWSSLSLGNTLHLPKCEQQLIVGCIFDLYEPVKDLLALRPGNESEISPSSIVVGCKLALRFGSVRALDALLESRIDAEKLEADGFPLLHHAVSTLKLESIKFCLARFSGSINKLATSFTEERWNTAPLLIALLSVDYRNPRNEKDIIVELLNVRGIDVNVAGPDGRTALHIAMSSASITPEIVEELINHGCKGIFQRDQNGMTPMVLGEWEIEHNAATLVAQFARDRAQEVPQEGTERTYFEVDDASRKLRLLDDTESPVQKAARQGSDQLGALIKEGKWEGKAIQDLTTALLLAAENANFGCLDILLESGLVHVDSQDQWGFTALMAAVLSRKWDVVKFLRKRGATSTMETKKGRSALTFAAKEGKVTGLRAILSVVPGMGLVDVNHQDSFGGLTALHYACMKRYNEENEPFGKFDENLELVEALLSYGAQIDVKDNRERTPLQIAIINGKNDVVERLSGEVAEQDSLREELPIKDDMGHGNFESWSSISAVSPEGILSLELDLEFQKGLARYM